MISSSLWVCLAIEMDMKLLEYYVFKHLKTTKQKNNNPRASKA